MIMNRTLLILNINCYHNMQLNKIHMYFYRGHILHRELNNYNGKVSVITCIFIYLFYSLNRCILRCRFQIYNRFSAVTCSFRVMKV